MGRPAKKSVLLKTFQMAVGYSLGTLSWVFGFYCLELETDGALKMNLRHWIRHGLKLMAWVAALGLLAKTWPVYRDWLLSASAFDITLAFLVKGVLFLYIRVFWPAKLVDLLPGMRHFLCPQCLQKQAFRFTPVSFRFGFFVTYLCRYCFCLVDGWGRQIFFPSPVSFKRASGFLVRLIPAALGFAGAGWLISRWIWNLL
jgi:hypothetical protein